MTQPYDPNDPRGRRPESWESAPTQHIPAAQQSGGYEQPPGPYQQQPPQYRQHPAQQPLNPFGAESNDSFGIAATVFALLGGVVGIVALTALDWLSQGQGLGRSLTFSDLHDFSDTPALTGFASTYFSWLAWVFLIVAVVAAVGSSFPSPAVRALRTIGVVVGVAGAGLSFLALRFNDSSQYSEIIKHARAGFYLYVVACLLAAAGAAIGPRKV